MIVLIRHGRTDWTDLRLHTGRKDMPLNEEGRSEARKAAFKLEGFLFQTVLSSPLARARETAEICGFGQRLVTVDDLMEWNYGDYEGLTVEQIREKEPAWTPWTHGYPGGETHEDVAVRARRVLERVQAEPGPVAIFAHGHLLRTLTACYLGLPPGFAGQLMLQTGCISVLDREFDLPAIRRWNR
jgi:probable phosphoglycerate mutase